jgi:hypothetical protein
MFLEVEKAKIGPQSHKTEFVLLNLFFRVIYWIHRPGILYEARKNMTT